MRLLQIPLLAVLTLFSLITLSAQDESPYSRFDIFLYPEYDHPGIGVFIEIDTREGEYPRLLKLLVPDSLMVALLHVDEGQDAVRLEYYVEDGKSYLPVEITSPQVKLQYYFNPFDAGVPERKATFKISIDDRLPEFHVVIQKPLAAENFQHSLIAPDEVDGQRGMKFYRAHIEGLAPGELYSMSFGYDNPGNVLSVSRLQTTDGQTGPAVPAGPKSNFGLVLALAVGIALVIIVLMRRSGQLVALPAQKASGKSASSTGFCSGCGTPKRPGAKFCGNCGREF